MKTLKTYKFRLNPNEATLELLKQHGGNGRFLWNQLVSFSKDFNDQKGRFPTQSELQKQIVVLKEENDFLKTSHSQPLQINAKRLNKTNFDSIKPEKIKERKIKLAKAKTPKQKAKALNFGKPKHKSKHDKNDSIFYPQNFKVKKGRIFVAKIGWIPFIKHRDILGVPKTLTINQDGEQWFCSIVCEIKLKQINKKPLSEANIVGIDVGLTTFATMSDGSKIENPRTLRKNLKKLKKEQKRISRRKFIKTEINGNSVKSSSKNRIKQKNKVRRIHRKVKNVRSDFLHKTSHYMIAKYDGVIIETLGIKNMLENGNSNQNRETNDVSWFEFGRKLEYKAKQNEKYFVKIERFFPSTKTCSKCKSIKDMELKDRTYKCPVCGLEINRDHNAAINILEEGIKVLKNTTGTVGINACGQSAVADMVEARKVSKTACAA